MSTYYVDSALGSDSNSGVTRAAPWQTLDKVKTLITSKVIGRGDTVLFRRGGEWYGQLDSFTPSAPGAAHLVIGAYGSGNRPRFLGYKVLNDDTKWTSLGANLWRINLTANNGDFTGNVANTSANIGFLLVDSAMYGAYKATPVAQWDFTYDDTAKTLTVYSVGNPATITTDLRAAPKGNGITPATSMSFLDLEVEGFGGHGWRGDGTVGDYRIVGCRFVRIGGSTLAGGSRFGNGGEAWIGSFDVTDTFNVYEDIYDVGSTQQGPVTGGQTGWLNVRHEHNMYVNCNQSFEVWGSGSAPTGGFKRSTFRYNLCINPGFSWGGIVRPDTAGKGNQVMSYDMALPADIDVSHNVFFGAYDAYRYHRSGSVGSYDYTPPAGMVFHDNVIVLDEGTKLTFFDGYTVEQFATWRTALNTEVGSLFLSAPSDLVTALEASRESAVQRVLSFLTVQVGSEKAMSEMNRAGIDAVARIATRALAMAETALPNGATRDVPLQTGFYYGPARAAATTITIPINVLRGPAWVPEASGALDRLAFEITTAGGSGSLVRGALCRVIGANQYEVIQDLGTVSGETTGIIEFTTASAHVKRGEKLWLAIAPQGSGTPPVVRAVIGLSNDGVSSSSASFMFSNNVTGYTLSGVTAGVPTSGTMGQTTDTPRIIVRAA